MKKAIVLLLALAVLGGAAFAEDAAYDLSASATMTWGLNLETNKHGFTNAAEFELVFPLVAGASASADGEGTYGTISVTGVNLSIISDGSEGNVADNADGDGYYDTIEAKIVSGDLFVKIYSKPSFKYTNAQYITPFKTKSYTASSAVTPAATINGGLTLGYGFGDLGSVSFMLASTGDWGATAAGTFDPADGFTLGFSDGTVEADGETMFNLGTGALYAEGAMIPLGPYGIADAAAAAFSADDQYVFGGSLTLTPADLITVNAAGFYNVKAKTLGLTGKVTLAPIDGLSVIGAIDAQKVDTADLAFDAYGKVSFSFMEAKDSINFETYYTKDRLDFGLKFVDAEGFVPGLGFTLAGYLYDMTKTNDPLKSSIAEEFWYKAMLDDVNSVKFYQKAYYDLVGADLYFNVGVEAKIIANTTFTLDYAAGTFGNNDNTNIAGAVNAFAEDKGIIKFITKIEL